MKTSLVLLALFASVTAEWGPIVRLSETDSASSTDIRSLVVQGDFVHALWQEPCSGGRNIYHRASTDNGDHWGAAERLGGSASSYNVSYYMVAGTGECPALHVRQRRTPVQAVLGQRPDVEHTGIPACVVSYKGQLEQLLCPWRQRAGDACMERRARVARIRLRRVVHR